MREANQNTLVNSRRDLLPGGKKSALMNVLLIHNKYREAGGGEDAVFQAESELLRRYGHNVESLIFDNKEIRSFADKVLSGVRLVYNPVSARMLAKKIQQCKPDIIHVHNFFPIASPSVFFVARRHNIPVVLTLHNYRLICPSTMLFHNNKIYEKSIHTLFPLDAIFRGVYRNSKLQTAALVMMTALHAVMGTWKNRVDQYIALTEFARKKFAASAIGFPTQKLRVKPNFVFDHGMGNAVRSDFFLFVGRLAEYKGIPTLLKAFTLNPFKLVIIGDGPLQEMVADFARQNPNVTYLGFQPQATVMRYLKTCKALVFPSIVYEGLPIIILQAFSAGTVVVASRLGGMAEIIRDGVNGFHFEAGNERDLFSCIAEIMADPRHSKAVSVNARSTYVDHYTPEKNYSLLMNIYKRALSSKTEPV